MRKRLLSTLLALCMVLTLLPGTAYAADGTYTDPSGVTYDYSQSYSWIYSEYLTVIGLINNYNSSTGSYVENITVPSTINGYPVTELGAAAFGNCQNIKSVTIPGSASLGGNSAYYGVAGFGACQDLNAIYVSGNSAYYKSINGILYSSNGTRLICYPPGKSNTSFTVSDTVTDIYELAFANCVNIREITIPSSVTSIGWGAFFKCTGLTTVYISSSVKSIDESAFNSCTGITDVYFDGTREQWNSIDIGSYNDPLTSAAIHCTSDATGESAFVGTWEIDDEKTMSVNGVSMTSIFGNDYSKYGNSMKINTDHTFTYYIAVGYGGEGEWQFDDSKINYEITTYEENSHEVGTLQINELGENEYYLVMPIFNNYQIYWRKVNSSPGPIGEISLQLDSDTISVGDTVYISASFLHDGSFQESDVTWSSSDDGIATVTPTGAMINDTSASAIAKIEGISEGPAIITVSLTDGRSASCEITVKETASDPDDNSSIDEYIINRVKSYTSDDVHDQWMDIMNSNDPDEVKTQRLIELFTKHGLLDVREGVAYLSYVPADRLHYLMLTDNSCYSAYQYYDWLYHTVKGKATIALLWVDGLIFNNELSTWTNPLTYTDPIGNVPGVSKYKDMLYKFMDETSFDIELMDYVSNVSKLAKNATSGGKLYADKVINQLNQCKTIDEIYEIISDKNMDARGLYQDIATKFDEATGEYKISFKLDETSGFGQFNKAMGYSGKIISATDATITLVTDLMALDAKLAVYEQYGDFLREIMLSSDIPWELSLAAYSVLQDMDDGAFGKIADFALDLVELTGVAGTVNEEMMDMVLDKNQVTSLGEYMVVIKITSWLINQVVDIGAMVREVACIVGYAKMQEHYVQKLEQSKERFLHNQSAENAWDFYENYNLLYQLRYKGEEALLKLYKIDGIAKYFSDFGYGAKEELVNVILAELENCRFTLDEGIDPPKSLAYVSKSVVNCPVNVEIYAPNGDYITTLVDGVESDITNEYGRFAVVYRVYSGDYAKVICMSQEGNYTFKLNGVNDGLVDFELARKSGEDILQYRFNNVKVSSGVVIQTSIEQLAENQTYDIDTDGDGEFEGHGNVQQVNESIYTHVNDITLNMDETTLFVGENTLLMVSVLPLDATRQGVSWTSDNPDVASVLNGRITAISPGIATIHCISQDNPDLVKTCVVTVQNSATITIIFNPTGGILTSGPTATTNENGKLSSLPIPTRNGYTFDGWYTAAEGGTKITTDTKFTEDTTIYAHWTKKQTPPIPSGDIDSGSGNNGSSSDDETSGSGSTGSGNTSSGGSHGSGYSGSSSSALGNRGNSSTGNTGTAVVAPSGNDTVSGSGGVFTDVPYNHTFATQIAWVRDNGIMSGYSDGSFRPNANTTRQALWMVLGRMAGANPASMAEARTWAINAGISDGTNSEGNMSRQQMITMLYRYAQSQGLTISGSADLSGYPDNGLVADYAKEALAWGVASGIITGTTDGRLNPEGTATRAHFAAFVYRFANLNLAPASGGSEGDVG